MIPFLRLSIAASAALLLGAGCAFVPQKFTAVEQQKILQQDRLRATFAVEPLGEQLTLAEAIARGIKYNMDHRVRMMEEAVAVGQLDLSRFDVLPNLVANAGYSHRDKYSISKAVDSVTKEASLSNPYISSARAYATADLGLNWSILDFGLSHISASQNADRLLAAGERRRRAMHLLVQDIQSAYLRAASAEKLRDALKETEALAEGALEDSREIERQALRSPLEVLRYRKALLDNLKLLESIEQELASARIELAQLINLPHTNVALEDPDDMVLPALPEAEMEDLETVALMNNAVLGESLYTARIAAAETRKGLLRLLPDLSFTYGPQYTNNSYTINQHWLEGSAKVSMNLVSLFSLPAKLRHAEAENQLAQTRRTAVQMSVVTQLHLARQQVENARRLYRRSVEIAAVDRQVETVTRDREREGATSHAELVSAITAAIVSDLRKYQALSQAMAAAGQFQSSLGVEAAVGSVHDMPLDALTATIAEAARQWNEGEAISGMIPQEQDTDSSVE